MKYIIPKDKRIFLDPNNNEPGVYQRVWVQGYFTQTQAAVAVVARLTIINDQLKGWKAYMGGSNLSNEDQVVLYVAGHGNALPYEYAKAFFNGPGFPKRLYDNGW